MSSLIILHLYCQCFYQYLGFHLPAMIPNQILIQSPRASLAFSTLPHSSYKPVTKADASLSWVQWATAHPWFQISYFFHHHDNISGRSNFRGKDSLWLQVSVCHGIAGIVAAVIQLVLHCCLFGGSGIRKLWPEPAENTSQASGNALLLA